MGKAHSEAVRGIESKAGEFYREGLEGSEKRAREAARSDGISVRYGWRRDEFYTLKYSMLEERLELPQGLFECGKAARPSSGEGVDRGAVTA